MINIIKAENRMYTEFDWLKTYWLFSFSGYYEQNNLNHGLLRVFNDDRVMPETGFPSHPHKEMEIVTIVFDGEITHEDNMGNISIVKSHDIQRMSAGKGIMHSEMNRSDKPLHLYQIWFYPNEKQLEPSYEQRSFDPSLFKDNLLPVVSGVGVDNTVFINSNITLYLGNLGKSKSLKLNIDKNNMIFVYIKSGSLSVNENEVNKGDQIRLNNESSLSFLGLDSSEFIVIDSTPYLINEEEN